MGNFTFDAVEDAEYLLELRLAFGEAISGELGRRFPEFWGVTAITPNALVNHFPGRTQTSRCFPTSWTFWSLPTLCQMECSSSGHLSRVYHRIIVLDITAWTISTQNLSHGTRILSRNDLVRSLPRQNDAMERWCSFFIPNSRPEGRLPKKVLPLDEQLTKYISHLYQERDLVSPARWMTSESRGF